MAIERQLRPPAAEDTEETRWKKRRGYSLPNNNNNNNSNTQESNNVNTSSIPESNGLYGDCCRDFYYYDVDYDVHTTNSIDVEEKTTSAYCTPGVSAFEMNGVILNDISSAERIENLRETMGDFGLALFSPLLKLEEMIREEPPLKRDDSTPSTAVTIETEAEPDIITEDEMSDHQERNSNDDSRLIILPEPDVYLQACSRILSIENMEYLRQFLPFAVRENAWERCFAIGLHGDSFCTLIQKTAKFKYTIVVIRTVSGEILGGFASEKWTVRDEKGQCRNSYYGTGQSFVFASHPDIVVQQEQQPNKTSSNDNSLFVYKWTGENDYCQICDSERRILCMGGVGDFGWIVADDFTTGQTGTCRTFANPPLCKNNHTFQIADFEIYGLTPTILNFGSVQSLPDNIQL